MDLTRAVLWRGYDLNGAVAQVGKPGLIGSSVDDMAISQISVLQYIDKAYQHDGMDFQGVGNLATGTRTIDVTGTLYGQSRGDLWDRLDILRTLLDPVDTYAANQGDYGFLALAWTETTGGSGGTGPRHINARPEGIRYVMNRDKHGTAAKVSGKSDATGMAVQWACRFIARDPRVYGLPHVIDLVANPSGTVTNAGDYPGIYDFTLALSGAAGAVTVVLDGKTITIAIASGSNGRIVRYRGLTRLMTLQDTALSQFEVLRMDLLNFTTKHSDTQHPKFTEKNVASAYSFSASGVAIQAGSTLNCSDAWS